MKKGRKDKREQGKTREGGRKRRRDEESESEEKGGCRRKGERTRKKERWAAGRGGGQRRQRDLNCAIWHFINHVILHYCAINKTTSQKNAR